MRWTLVFFVLASAVAWGCTSSSNGTIYDGGLGDVAVDGSDVDSDADGDSGQSECGSGAESCDTTGAHRVCLGGHWSDDPCPAPTMCTTSDTSCQCPDGGATQITGTVYAPNGLDPVSHAFVFLASDPTNIPKEEAGAHCIKCLSPTLVRKSTLTDAEGKFALGDFAEGQQQTVVVRKGPFQRAYTLTPTQCSANAIPSDAIKLPADPTEAGTNGRFPMLAVSTGMFDRMEGVIQKLGINLDFVDIFNGGGDPAVANKGNSADELFAGFDSTTGEDNIMKYDVVFINCGQSGGSWDTIAQTRKELFDRYVARGGRLYVTDMAYDFVEQTFPDKVAFLNDSGSTAGAIDAAEKGSAAASVTGTVEDQSLRTWLETNFASQISGGQVNLVGWLQNWAVVDSFTPSPPAQHDTDYRDKDLWVQGNVTYGTGTSGVKPLTLSFNVDPAGTAAQKPEERLSCGRVLFSSYHTFKAGEGTSDAGVDGGATADISVQERILEYMILEIGVTFCENIVIG